MSARGPENSRISDVEEITELEILEEIDGGRKKTVSSVVSEDQELDHFVLLALSKNGRKISMSSVGKRRSKKSERQRSKSKSKKHSRRKSITIPPEQVPQNSSEPSPANEKRTVLRRIPINRRLTRGALPTDKRSRKSLDRLEFLFKDAIESNEARVEMKSEKQKDDAESLPWTLAKSSEQVVKLIKAGNEAIQANSCGIDAEAMELICRHLEKNATVKKLSLAGNKIGDIGALALKEVLDSTCCLHYVHLWGNNLGDVGADTIADALKDNKTLTYLILSKNAISDLGAESLCEALSYNTTLTFLDVGENCMNDEGATHFANLIKTRNQTLQHLDLSDNGISIVGARTLARALKFNTGIEELTLAFNEVTETRTQQQLQAIGWTMFSQ